MKCIRETPNLYRLVHIAPINSYFVREEDGLTLVDANLPGRGGQIAAAASKLGLPIRRVVLTHAHQDHVGSLDEICTQFPNLEVFIGSREARLLRQDFSFDTQEPKSRLKGKFPAVKTRPTRVLDNGDQVGSLQAFSSPGHTPGHVAYLDMRDRALLAGDAFQTAGGIAVAGVVRPLFPLPAWFTWERRLAAESARKLGDLRPSLLACGHGPVLPSPEKEIKRAIEVAQRRLG